jgi:hypothetical protein
MACAWSSYVFMLCLKASSQCQHVLMCTYCMHHACVYVLFVLCKMCVHTVHTYITVQTLSTSQPITGTLFTLLDSPFPPPDDADEVHDIFCVCMYVYIYVRSGEVCCTCCRQRSGKRAIIVWSQRELCVCGRVRNSARGREKDSLLQYKCACTTIYIRPSSCVSSSHRLSALLIPVVVGCALRKSRQTWEFMPLDACHSACVHCEETAVHNNKPRN